MSTPRRLLLSPRAAADLEDIAEFIARDNPERPTTFVEELEAKCRAVAATPDIYPARPDLAPGLRSAVHGRYLVLFRELRPARPPCASSACCTAPATSRG